jgi:excisionase family DNA binding protein
MQQEMSNDADRHDELITVGLQELKDWIRGEIRQLADHFGREFREQSRQPAPEYLSVKQAARIMGLSIKRIREAVIRREMAASNIGSEARPVYRIARGDLEKWLEERKRGGPSPARAELRAIVERYFPNQGKKSR